LLCFEKRRLPTSPLTKTTCGTVSHCPIQRGQVSQIWFPTWAFNMLVSSRDCSRDCSRDTSICHHHVATKRCTHPKRRFWKDEPTFQRLNQSAFSFVVITASYLRFSYGLPPRRESDRLSVGSDSAHRHAIIIL